ncbi:MAG: hypothetical protein POH28_15400, partial [Acidocella sp.]|nr:hypothetical protein [Acidocella sp.]
MMKIPVAILVCAMLAGCAPVMGESQGQQADDNACVAQADATYHALDEDQLARTGQNGLLYGATPTHVFDAEQMGAMRARQSELSTCEQNGNTGGPVP